VRKFEIRRHLFIGFDESFFNDLPARLDAFLGHELGETAAFFGAVRHLGRRNECAASAFTDKQAFIDKVAQRLTNCDAAQAE